MTNKKNHSELTIANNLPDPIARYNEKLEFVFINKAYLNLIHKTEEDVIGKTNCQLGTMPEKVLEEWTDLLKGIFQTGKPAEMETYYSSGDEIFYIITKVVPEFDQEGKVISALAIGRDVTAVKSVERRTEKTLQSYLLKLSDALRELTDAEKIKETACRVIGEHLQVTRVLYVEKIIINGVEYYKPEGYYSIDTPFPPDLLLAENHRAGAGPLYKGNATISNDVMKEMPGEEGRFYIQYNILSFMGVPLIKNGELIMFFGVHHNQPRVWQEYEVKLLEETAERTWAAVERAKAERELKELNESLESLVEQRSKEIMIKNRQLESLHAELKTFNNIAATDYNETLKNLYTSLEFLITNDARNLSDSGRANIRRAQGTIQRMKLLTEDLLSYSKLQELDERKNLELRKVWQTVINDMEAKLKGIQLRINAQEVHVNANPFLLSLVFHHLLDNAIKFRKKDGEHCISIDIKPSVANHHIVSITDNGIGFPAGESEKIFDMFYHLHEQSKYKASGIGLAICKKIMHLHGGFITTESEPGKGSTFCCHFPVA